MISLVILNLIAGCAFGQNDYISKAGHAAVLAEQKLLIDGGMVAYIPQRPTYDNRTWIIDLSESWTNSSVQPVSIVRPEEYVSLELGTLWYDALSNSVYSFGGELSGDGYNINPVGLSGVPEDSIWQFKFEESNASGIWTQALGPLGDKIFPSDIKRPIMGATAADSNNAYYIGAQAHNRSTDKVGNMSLHNLPGIIQFSFSNATLVNSTNDGSYFASTLQSINNQPSAVAGMMTYVRPFGTEGVFITVGGFQIVDNVTGQTNQWWHNVTIYDPSTQSWHYQRATGDIPKLSWSPGEYIYDQRANNFCAFGAWDDVLSTYDIFIFGSFEGFTNGNTYYILSLPSFTWFASGMVSSPSRKQMTCTSTNNRQAIIVGGTNTDQVIKNGDPQNWETQDPWTKGIAVFDMTALQYVDRYNAEASSYKSPSIIQDFYNPSDKYRFPIWDDPALEAIFHKTKNGVDSAWKIIVGVVCSVTGFLVCAAIWWWRKGRAWWQLKRRHASDIRLEPQELAEPPPYSPGKLQESWRTPFSQSQAGIRLERPGRAGSDRIQETATVWDTNTETVEDESERGAAISGDFKRPGIQDYDHDHLETAMPHRGDQGDRSNGLISRSTTIRSQAVRRPD